MGNELKRKEVWLDDAVINGLQLLANKKQWSLKQYMEDVLIKQSAKANPENNAVLSSYANVMVPEFGKTVFKKRKRK